MLSEQVLKPSERCSARANFVDESRLGVPAMCGFQSERSRRVPCAARSSRRTPEAARGEVATLEEPATGFDDTVEIVAVPPRALNGRPAPARPGRPEYRPDEFDPVGRPAAPPRSGCVPAAEPGRRRDSGRPAAAAVRRREDPCRRAVVRRGRAGRCLPADDAPAGGALYRGRSPRSRPSSGQPPGRRPADRDRAVATGALGLVAASLATGTLFAAFADGALADRRALAPSPVVRRRRPGVRQDIGFFVFSLPFELLVSGLLIWLIAVAAAFVAVVYWIRGCARPAAAPRRRSRPRCTSRSLAASLLLVVAWRFHLEQYVLELGQPSLGGRPVLRGRRLRRRARPDTGIWRPSWCSWSGWRSAAWRRRSSRGRAQAARRVRWSSSRPRCSCSPCSRSARCSPRSSSGTPSIRIRFPASSRTWSGRSRPPGTPSGSTGRRRAVRTDRQLQRRRLLARPPAPSGTCDLGSLAARGPDARARHRHALLPPGRARARRRPRSGAAAARPWSARASSTCGRDRRQGGQVDQQPARVHPRPRPDPLLGHRHGRRPPTRGCWTPGSASRSRASTSATFRPLPPAADEDSDGPTFAPRRPAAGASRRGCWSTPARPEVDIPASEGSGQHGVPLQRAGGIPLSIVDRPRRVRARPGKQGAAPVRRHHAGVAHSAASRRDRPAADAGAVHPVGLRTRCR